MLLLPGVLLWTRQGHLLGSVMLKWDKILKTRTDTKFSRLRSQFWPQDWGHNFGLKSSLCLSQIASVTCSLITHWKKAILACWGTWLPCPSPPVSPMCVTRTKRRRSMYLCAWRSEMDLCQMTHCSFLLLLDWWAHWDASRPAGWGEPRRRDLLS